MTYSDKIAHYAVSYTIASMLSVFFDLYFACFLALMIGIGKEIYDNATDGTFDFYDLIADTLGIATFLILCLLE
jgi:hypothetical protein